MGARWRAALLAVAVAGLAAGFLPAVHAASPPANPCDWPTYGHDVGHSFAATAGCTPLSPLNASTLAPDWVFPTPDSVSASPTVVDGTVYVGDWRGTFYALPAAPGAGAVKPRWTFRVDDTNSVAFGRIVSSAAVTTIGTRQLVLFGGGATLYALDTKTGKKVASICLDPRADPAVRCSGSGKQVEVESSPAVVKIGGETRVLVGLDVHNDQDVGRTGLVEVTLNEQGFKPKWKFDPEGPSTYTGANLLTEGSGTGNGCASVWSSPAVDEARSLAVFGTGSCSVDGITSGESMYAVDLLTGALRWVYHPPRASTRYDDDFGASANVLPGGLVGNGSKDGWYYAVAEDPAPDGSARLAWANHVGESGHASTDFAVGGVIGTPAVGTVGDEPAIFVTTAISTPIDKPLDEGGGSLDTTLVDDPGRMLSLSALRASDGALLWRAPLARQSYGAPTYANGVVLVPATFDFALQAYDANTGLLLSTIPLAGAPSSAPAIVGDRVFVGAGTRTTDLEFKAFGGGVLDPVLGASPLSPASGVYGFRLPVAGS
jgi:polyvinyl alcohol dehydrogenase (cytochrome)